MDNVVDFSLVTKKTEEDDHINVKGYEEDQEMTDVVHSLKGNMVFLSTGEMEGIAMTARQANDLGLALIRGSVISVLGEEQRDLENK